MTPMGQYFIAVNDTKREWMHPHRFGDGLTFFEFSSGRCGFLAGFALLLRDSDTGGKGDWFSSSAPVDALKRYPIVGSWAGDQVYLSGDYDCERRFSDAMNSYRDVSFEVLKALCTNDYFRSALKTRTQWVTEKTFGGVDAQETKQYKEVWDIEPWPKEAGLYMQ